MAFLLHKVKKKVFFMNLSNLVPVVGMILSMTRENGCCGQQISLRTPEGMVHFAVSEETMIVDSKRLRPGMRVAAFYDSSLPVPLIFPPRYQAQLIAPLRGEEEILLAFFDQTLTAADGSLQLKVDRRTRVETINGQSFPCNLRNRMLLVYYTETTRSLPPQTSPSRIIAFCG